MAEKPAPKKVEKKADVPLSNDSRFSTIKENTDLPENTPPPGRHVIEERGEPKDEVPA